MEQEEGLIVLSDVATKIWERGSSTTKEGVKHWRQLLARLHGKDILESPFDSPLQEQEKQAGLRKKARLDQKIRRTRQLNEAQDDIRRTTHAEEKESTDIPDRDISSWKAWSSRYPEDRGSESSESSDGCPYSIEAPECIREILDGSESSSQSGAQSMEEDSWFSGESDDMTQDLSWRPEPISKRRRIN